MNSDGPSIFLYSAAVDDEAPRPVRRRRDHCAPHFVSPNTVTAAERGPEGGFDFEAGVRIGENVTEEAVHLVEALSGGLGVYAETCGDLRGGAVRGLEAGQKGGGETVALLRGE